MVSTVKLKCDVAKRCPDAQRRDHCSYQKKIHWGNSMMFVFWSCQVTLRGRRCALPCAPSRFYCVSVEIVSGIAFWTSQSFFAQLYIGFIVHLSILICILSLSFFCSFLPSLIQLNSIQFKPVQFNTYIHSLNHSLTHSLTHSFFH